MAKTLFLFPGSVEEYERFRKYKVEIVNLGNQDKGISFSPLEIEFDLRKKKLIKQNNIEALVNVSKEEGHSRPGVGASYYLNYYGLPVRRKK